MNAYLVSAKDVRVIQEYIDYWARYEVQDVADVVFAESRGKAKATFASRYAIEFTDVSSCLWIVEGVDRPRGIAESTDPIWESAHTELARLAGAH